MKYFLAVDDNTGRIKSVGKNLKELKDNFPHQIESIVIFDCTGDGRYLVMRTIDNEGCMSTPCSVHTTTDSLVLTVKSQYSLENCDWVNFK